MMVVEDTMVCWKAVETGVAVIVPTDVTYAAHVKREKYWCFRGNGGRRVHLRVQACI